MNRVARSVRSSAITTSRNIRNRKTRVLAAAAISAAAVTTLAQSATAQNLYWDRNGTAAGTSATSTGSWDLASLNWTTDSNGSLTTSAWASGNTAVFSAGTNGTGTFTVTVPTGITVPGINGITFEEGTVTIAGPGTLSLNTGTVTISSAAGRTQTINAAITGGGGTIVRAGTGSLTLGGANDFTGQLQLGTTAAVGTTTITNGSALGAGGTGNDTVFATAAGATSGLRLSGGITVANENITLNNGGIRSQDGQLSSVSGSNTWGGNVLISGIVNNEGTGLASIGAATGTTLRIDGVIDSVGSILTVNGSGQQAGATVGSTWGKIGAGTVVLGGTSPNTNHGFNRLIQGLTIVEKDAAFGDAAYEGFIDSAVIMNTLSGTQPSLAFRAPASSSGFTYSTYENITLPAQEFGLNNTPLIDNLGGNNVFTGDFRITGLFDGGSDTVRTTFGAQAGSSLELSGHLWVSGSSHRQITKLGGGELIISGQNDGQYGKLVDGTNTAVPFPDFAWSGGTVAISAGTVTLRNTVGNADSGSLRGDPGAVYGGIINVRVDPAGTFKIDNTNGIYNNGTDNNRLSPNATVFVNGGEYEVIGNGTTSVVQQAGGTISLSGYSTLTVVNPGSATTTLDGGSITRANGKDTALVRGIDGVNSKMRLNAGANNYGLIGSGGAGTLQSIIPYLVGDASATGIGTDFVTYDVANDTVKLLGPSDYIALTDGNSTVANASSASSSTLNASTTVNSLKLAAPQTLTVNNRLFINSGALLSAGGGSSTISGTGSIDFNNQEGIIHTIAGSDLTINTLIRGNSGLTKSGTGMLTLTADNSSSLNGTITINAGTLGMSNGNNLGSGSNPVLLNGGALRATTNNLVVSTNELFLGSPQQNGIDVPTGLTMTWAGRISSAPGTSYKLDKLGGGTLILTNNNSGYDGGEDIHAGTLQVNSNLSPLGSGTVYFEGGTLFVNGGASLTTNDGINNKPMVLLQSGTIAQSGGGYLEWFGQISGPGDLIINGGTFNPDQNTTATNAYTGKNIINNATLRYTDARGLGTVGGVTPGYYTLNNSTLQTVGYNDGAANQSIASFNVNRGITLGSGGGTLDVRIGNLTTNYGVTWGQVISGTGNLAVIGDSSGTLITTGTVSGANTFVGKTLVNIPQFFYSSDAAFGAVPTSVTPDSITLTGGQLFQGTANMTLNVNRGITITGGGTEQMTSTALTTTTINGAINGGSASITKTFASGTLNLTNSGNTWTGSTTVALGTLGMAGTNAVPANSTFTFGSGANQVGMAVGLGATVGNQTLNNFTETGTGMHFISSNSTAVSTLTINNNAASQIHAPMSGPMQFVKGGTGELTLTSPAGVTSGFNSGPGTAGTGITGGVKVTGGTMTVGNDNQFGAVPASASAANITLDGGTLKLANNNLGSIAVGGTTGGYTAIPTVALTQTSDLPAAARAVVNVGTVGVTAGGTGYTAAPAITFSNPNVPGGVAATGTASISGGAVTAINIVNPGSGYTSFPTVTIGAVTGASGATAQINANLTGITMTDAGMNFTGTPTVAITGGNGSATATATVANFTGISANRGITVGPNGGTLETPNNITYGGAVAGAGVATAGTFHKTGAGNINVASVRGVGGLDVANGNVSVNAGRSTAKTSVVGAISVAAGSSLDLNDQDLIVDYTGGSPFSTVQSLIKSGYNSGSWNGTGIKSTAAATNNAVPGAHAAALGYVEANSVGFAGGGTFSGQAVDGSSVLVRYTLAGDSNVDGTVDLTDFTFLAANFNTVGTANWLQGDYNYDGNVDLTDFTFLASNFNQTMPGDTGGGSASSSLGSLVPEPTSLGLVGLVAGGMLARRRRNRR